MRRMVLVVCAIASVFTAAACSSGDDSSSDATATPKTNATTTTTAGRDTNPLPAGYAGYHSVVYAKPESWLCRGDERDDLCDTQMDATIIGADGSTPGAQFTPVADAQ